MSPYTSRNYANLNEWMISIPSLERYADVGVIDQRAQRIPAEQPAWLTDHCRTALQVIVLTIRGRHGESAEENTDYSADA